MRPLVPSISALAAVALCGGLVAGISLRSPERAGGAEGASETSPRDATPGFYAGSLPPRLQAAGAGPTGAASPLAPSTSPSSSASLPAAGGEPGGPPQRARELQDAPDLPYHEFYFTRAVYNDGGGLRGIGRWRGRGSWSIDYPKADRQFMVMVDHLVNMDLHPDANAVRLDDPAIRRFPWLYALEVGGMRLSEAEVHGLRDYLDAGGFLVIDDFWGPWEWENFEREISRVLPGRPIVELDLDHPIFHAFYDIEEILQVPNRNNGIRGGPTWEQGGRVPHVRGIFDDHDRLMVVINYNTDLGDAWEWAENPFYPLKYSRFAAEMGINMIVYGMSH